MLFRSETSVSYAQEETNKANATLATFTFNVSPGLKAMSLQLMQLQNESNKPNEVMQEQLTVIDREITQTNIALSEIRKSIASISATEAASKRIVELEEREKSLAELHEKYSAEMYLCEQFIRTKVDILTSKINGKFRLARFVLFKKNITNDGIEECCETTFNGVPYSDLNNAARINTGLDIISTLIEEYKFSAPIFIDNAEAVTSLIDIGNAQIGRFIVSEPDKVLRIEFAENAVRRAG